MNLMKQDGGQDMVRIMSTLKETCVSVGPEDLHQHGLLLTDGQLQGGGPHTRQSVPLDPVRDPQELWHHRPDPVPQNNTTSSSSDAGPYRTGFLLGSDLTGQT